MNGFGFVWLVGWMGCSHQGRPGAWEGRKIRRPGANKKPAEFRVPIKCTALASNACAVPASSQKGIQFAFFLPLSFKLFHPRNYGTLRNKRYVQTLCNFELCTPEFLEGFFPTSPFMLQISSVVAIVPQGNVASEAFSFLVPGGDAPGVLVGRDKPILLLWCT